MHDILWCVFQPGLLPVGCPRCCRDMAEGLCSSSPALVSDPLGHIASHASGGQGVHQKLRVEEQGDAVSVRAFDFNFLNFLKCRPVLIGLANNLLADSEHFSNHNPASGLSTDGTISRSVTTSE